MSEIKRCLSLLKRNNGSTPIIIICTILTVILAAAFISDIVYVAYEDYRLNRWAEKTARYGAENLIFHKSDLEEKVREYAVKNVNDLNELDINTADNSKEITVKMEKPFRYNFLGIIGFSGKQIKAKCTARISSISSVVGIRPFAVEKRKVVFGREYILSNKHFDKNCIPIVPLNLGKGNLKVNVVFGYRKAIKAGDGIYALKGNSEAMKEGFETLLKTSEENEIKNSVSGLNEKNVIIIPVIDTLTKPGENIMKISGFAAFYIRNFETAKDGIKLKGIFLRKTINGITSDRVEDYGLTGIKLIRR